MIFGVRKIFNMGGSQANASEASRPSACLMRSRGCRGWPPGGGCKAQRPLGKKILYFVSYICITSGPFWSMIFDGRKGAAILSISEFVIGEP